MWQMFGYVASVMRIEDFKQLTINSSVDFRKIVGDFEFEMSNMNPDDRYNLTLIQLIEVCPSSARRCSIS